MNAKEIQEIVDTIHGMWINDLNVDFVEWCEDGDVFSNNAYHKKIQVMNQIAPLVDLISAIFRREMKKKFLLINTATYMREQCDKDAFEVEELDIEGLVKAGFDNDRDKEALESLEVDGILRSPDYEGVIVVRVM